MNHLDEWKLIKERYEKLDQTPQIQYRIERINHLISQEETKEKDIAHFR